MFRQVDTKQPSEVEAAVAEIYRGLFSDADGEFVAKSFAWAEQCFSGEYEGYQPIDALYHDFEHTMQGTLCLARLLQGRERAGAEPPLTRRGFELGILAILFHDTGYLKRTDDKEGTGAKYTLVHVDRSADFADEFLAGQGVPQGERRAIQNMIRCTGVNADPESIPFKKDLDRMLGAALATADLLGQMAAPDYAEKLPILYLEFEEAVQHEDGGQSRLTQFGCAEDLIRKSPEFWRSYVLPRIENEFGGLHDYLRIPYPDGPNPYVEAVERNIARLQEQG